MELPHMFDFWLKILALTIDEVISFHYHYQQYYYTDTDADSTSVAGPGRGRKGQTAICITFFIASATWIKSSKSKKLSVLDILLFSVHIHYQTDYTMGDLGIPLHCAERPHMFQWYSITLRPQWALGTSLLLGSFQLSRMWQLVSKCRMIPRSWVRVTWIWL